MSVAKLICLFVALCEFSLVHRNYFDRLVLLVNMHTRFTNPAAIG